MDILIVEDEQLLAQELVEQLMELDNSIRIVGCLGSVGETVNWFATNSCDLIFLDIHLNDGLSFSIFEKIKLQTPVIFTTAYDQYAIKAFEVNSIAYLLKPISGEDLEKAWKKYKETKIMGEENIKQLLNYFQEKNEEKKYKERLMLAKGKVQKPVRVEDVAYFMAEGRYVFAIAKSGERYFYEGALYELEELLNSRYFFRVNRTYLVSYESIKELRPYGKGRLIVHLIPKVKQAPVVSADKANTFKEWLKK